MIWDEIRRTVLHSDRRVLALKRVADTENEEQVSSENHSTVVRFSVALSNPLSPIPVPPKPRSLTGALQ